MHYGNGSRLGVREIYTDMIYWYKEYVLKTPEQREQERRESKRKARTALAQLALVDTMCRGLGGGYY